MLTESDLRIRSAKLGASECAAAAGLDPFCPPIKLFLRRTGREPRDESPQADWGNVMETGDCRLVREGARRSPRQLADPSPSDRGLGVRDPGPDCCWQRQASPGQKRRA